MTNHERWLKEEDRGQKWRRLTPLGIAASLSTNFVGWGIIVWFICYFVQVNDKKMDIQREENNLLRQDLKDAKQQEIKDTQCLTREVFQCCGEKANASC